MPCATRTNAPNGTSFVTWPEMIAPACDVRSNSFQGSSWVALRESETRSRSRSTSSTSTSTSWPTVTTSWGWSTCFQLSSLTCTRPSTPPRSTNAPKFTIELTVPLRRSPFCRPFEELLAALALRLLEEGAAAQHDVVAVAVELDDLRLELGADERV